MLQRIKQDEVLLRFVNLSDKSTFRVGRNVITKRILAREILQEYLEHNSSAKNGIYF
jgi:hypothetical protein